MQYNECISIVTATGPLNTAVLFPLMQYNEGSGIDLINAHKSSDPPVDHTLEGANSELKAVFLKRRKKLVPQ